MATLSDRTIRRRQHRDRDLEITPWDAENLQPASYDLRIDDEWIVSDSQSSVDVYDPHEDPGEYGRLVRSDEYVLSPGQFILGSTIERIQLPMDLVGVVHGRSSYARIGVIPHLGGYCDPGFAGHVTLEIANFGDIPVRLHAGDRFCQIEFQETDVPVNTGYDGKYQDQDGVTGSRLHRDHQ